MVTAPAGELTRRTTPPARFMTRLLALQLRATPSTPTPHYLPAHTFNPHPAVSALAWLPVYATCREAPFTHLHHSTFPTPIPHLPTEHLGVFGSSHSGHSNNLYTASPPLPPLPCADVDGQLLRFRAFSAACPHRHLAKHCAARHDAGGRAPRMRAVAALFRLGNLEQRGTAPAPDVPRSALRFARQHMAAGGRLTITLLPHTRTHSFSSRRRQALLLHCCALSPARCIQLICSATSCI